MASHLTHVPQKVDFKEPFTEKTLCDPLAKLVRACCSVKTGRKLIVANREGGVGSWSLFSLYGKYANDSLWNPQHDVKIISSNYGPLSNSKVYVSLRAKQNKIAKKSWQSFGRNSARVELVFHIRLICKYSLRLQQDVQNDSIKLWSADEFLFDLQHVLCLPCKKDGTVKKRKTRPPLRFSFNFQEFKKPLNRLLKIRPHILWSHAGYNMYVNVGASKWWPSATGLWPRFETSSHPSPMSVWLHELAWVQVSNTDSFWPSCCDYLVFHRSETSIKCWWGCCLPAVYVYSQVNMLLGMGSRCLCVDVRTCRSLLRCLV